MPRPTGKKALEEALRAVADIPSKHGLDGEAPDGAGTAPEEAGRSAEGSADDLEADYDDADFDEDVRCSTCPVHQGSQVPQLARSTQNLWCFRSMWTDTHGHADTQTTPQPQQSKNNHHENLRSH